MWLWESKSLYIWQEDKSYEMEGVIVGKLSQ